MLRQLAADGVVLSEPTWRVWTPLDVPIPTTHPLNETCRAHPASKAGEKSRFPRLLIPNATLKPEMCVRSGKDLLSSVIMKRGHVTDYRQLIVLWKNHHATASRTGRTIFLELGANIGACTMALLIATDASVIAF